jgi:membrane-bound lytic murein transglycosylase MltF
LTRGTDEYRESYRNYTSRGSTGKDPQVLQNLPFHLKQQLHLGQRMDKHSSSLGGEKYILKIE